MDVQLNVSTVAESTSSDLTVPNTSAAGKWPALAAAMLGGVMIFGVGFADISVSHNAAHDTRHALVFPCH